MRLFSYVIPIDDGAAPNPFWGVCTLAICKPVIRRIAKKDDWIVGIGSTNVSSINYSGRLVYAMKITQMMNFQKYHRYCKMLLSPKIPDITNQDYKRTVGDCIYDFDKNPQGFLLPSVHSEENKETDLGGMNVLLSEHFYYFGQAAVELPNKFKVIISQRQGHQSLKNEPVKLEFIKWLEDNFKKNHLYGDPQIKINFQETGHTETDCHTIRRLAAKEDEGISYNDEQLPLSHWNYFLALESDLKNISRYIEIHESNFKTFSIGLTQLFLATCSEIDVILKEICKIVSLKKVKTIDSFFPVIAEKVPLLFQKTALIPFFNLKFAPFKDWQPNCPPNWWTAYNKVKHHRNTNYSDANLSNALNALAALYILIYELIRIYKGKSDTEFSGQLIYKHLQPAQELFMLEGENMWREIAEGKRNLFGR